MRMVYKRLRSWDEGRDIEVEYYHNAQGIPHVIKIVTTLEVEGNEDN
jgi:hypothetical protein